MIREEIIQGLYRGDGRAIKEAVKALEQKPNDDCVSRSMAINKLKEHYFDEKLQSAKDDPCVIDAMTDLDIRIIKELPPVTSTHIETVTDFADKCRRCGRTAITRAENDEILNEAWRLLMNVTEEDGVTAEQANGMLKLMSFFFYKYHGLKKKPDWVENVEARMEESEEK